MIKQATVEWWNTVPAEFRFVMVKRAQGNFLGDAWKSVQGFGNKLWQGVGDVVGPQGQQHIKNFAIGAGASMIPFGIYKAMGGKGGWGAGIGTALAGGAMGVAAPYAKDYVSGLMGGNKPTTPAPQAPAPAPQTPPPAGPPPATPPAQAPAPAAQTPPPAGPPAPQQGLQVS